MSWGTELWVSAVCVVFRYSLFWRCFCELMASTVIWLCIWASRNGPCAGSIARKGWKGINSDTTPDLSVLELIRLCLECPRHVEPAVVSLHLAPNVLAVLHIDIVPLNHLSSLWTIFNDHTLWYYSGIKTACFVSYNTCAAGVCIITHVL